MRSTDRWPDASNSSYGTVADQVRHSRNCSSRSLFWHKKQPYVYSWGPHTRTYQNLIPGHLREFQRIVDSEGPSTVIEDRQKRSSYKNFLWTSQKTFHTRTNAEHLPDQQGSFRDASQRAVRDHARTSKRGFHQDLYNSFSQGIVQEIDQDLNARAPKRIPQYCHKKTCCWRGSYKILI